MHISTYSNVKAQVDINKLINNGGVKQYSGRVGCCIRNYLIFEKITINTTITLIN